MLMSAAVSISESASTNGTPSRAARRRPMDDLPTPIMPTSTIERGPKRPRIAAAEACSFVSFCIVISVIYLNAYAPLPLPLQEHPDDPSDHLSDCANRLPVRREHDRTRSRQPAPRGRSAGA